MEFTSKQINEIVDSCEKELKTNDRIKFSFDRKWSNNFPKKAGIYAIFDSHKLVYVGETANLKERMKEVKRTINHSFRRKLGKYLYKDALIEKGRFNDMIENELKDYYEKNLSFVYKEVTFGRLEIESYLIHRNKGLLNSVGKRNKINCDD